MVWIKPEYALRLGLGATYLYSGLDLVRHPTGWTWAIRSLPEAMRRVIDAVGVENYLRIQGGFEILLAIAFLLWFLPRWTTKAAAIAASVHIASVLLLVGVSLETFRDFGILGAALALFLTL